MKKTITTFILCLGLALAVGGCVSPTPVEHYPWHGPIVDPNGNPVPEPHYEAIKN
jgi:hypothetical protein